MVSHKIRNKNNKIIIIFYYQYLLKSSTYTLGVEMSFSYLYPTIPTYTIVGLVSYLKE